MNISKKFVDRRFGKMNLYYSMINQYQIRELLKNNNFKIYFVENCSTMTRK